MEAGSVVANVDEELDKIAKKYEGEIDAANEWRRAQRQGKFCCAFQWTCGRPAQCANKPYCSGKVFVPFAGAAAGRRPTERPIRPPGINKIIFNVAHLTSRMIYAEKLSAQSK